jgi:SAM-dependent methyltransferase
VFGVDLSFDMVQQAADRLKKLAAANQKSKSAAESDALVAGFVWCGDMHNFAVAAPVDAVICLYDSFNYSLEPEKARRIMAQAANAVRPGGLFVFDVCTEHNCRRNFNNYYDRERYLDISYIRRAYFKPHRKLQINEFFITNDFNGGPTIFERHVQRIYSLREIDGMIDPHQWSVAGCFDGMSRRPGTEKSDRVHFVLRRTGMDT